MPATGTARAKTPLSRARALEIIQAMPYMVAGSNSRIKPGTVVPVAYEVEEDGRTYVFPEQPFYVVAEITRSWYISVLPKKLRRVNANFKHYYKISTD